ncbi:MAG: dienelactone hydrolase family protein [Halanaeroarchaeum sp.]
MSESNRVSIPVNGVTLPGDLTVPEAPTGLVVFAHGSGSSKESPRNQFVAASLADRGLATLLFDLLTEVEDRDRANRFDIELLTDRLLAARSWIETREAIAALPVGYFGSSTGAAAALRAAARRPGNVSAVVARGGRVDLAGDALPDVRAPTRMIVGGADESVLAMNREARGAMTCETDLAVVEGAGHLFEGEGELEEVAALAGDWFASVLGGD